MEILSDATFKGNVSISGGNFSVTCKGGSSPSFNVGGITTNNGSSKSEFRGGVFVNGDFSVTLEGNTIPSIEISRDNVSAYSSYIKVYGSEYISYSLTVGGPIHAKHGIHLNDSDISNWSDLNYMLDFAPSSLSTTVSSNTSKINSACSTISSLCTKVDSLCTTVASNTTKINSLCTKVDNILLNQKHTFANPTLPIGCTKFYFVDNVMDNGGYGNDYYKFRVNSTGTKVSSFQVFKGGSSGTNEEVQIDIKQHLCNDNLTRWFEGSLASNTTGYDESEFIIVFDEFKEIYPESVPQ